MDLTLLFILMILLSSAFSVFMSLHCEHITGGSKVLVVLATCFLLGLLVGPTAAYLFAVELLHAIAAACVGCLLGFGFGRATRG